MRALSIMALTILIWACTGVNSNPTTTQSEQIEDDSLSFTHFLEYFPATPLPYIQNENDLWDGILFFNDSLEEYDYDKTAIPYYLLEKWVINNENELSTKLTAVKRGLLDKDPWYAVQGGLRISETEQESLLIHFYEKTSEVNGGYWYCYWLTYDDKGKLLECLELGREGLYTFPIMEDTDENMFWARHTSYEALKIEVKSSSDFSVCSIKRDEIDGDLTEEELNRVDNIKVFNDSISGWMELFDDECEEY